MAAHVKKNDFVLVITGKDRGKKGRVLEVVPKKNAVLVEGVAIVTKHTKIRKAGDVGGIRKNESFIHISNVMLLDEATGKPRRA